MEEPERQTTKEKLIDAACEIFAEKGYRETTVADICEKAEANIAAVNYHFGDKESLYDACWRRAFEITSTLFPINGVLPENPGLEDYLYSYAYAIMHRIFSESEAGLFPKMLHQEMSNPTLALDRIAQEALLPQSRFLGEAIRAELGVCDEGKICRCMHSIIGQCAFYNFSRRLRECVPGCGIMSEEDINRIARHIAAFSLGGLKEIKKEPSL